MSIDQLMGSVRTEAAVVRALADEAEHAIGVGRSALWIRAQLIEEVGRLGSRLIDLAAELRASRSLESATLSNDPWVAAANDPH